MIEQSPQTDSEIELFSELHEMGIINATELIQSIIETRLMAEQYRPVMYQTGTQILWVEVEMQKTTNFIRPDFRVVVCWKNLSQPDLKLQRTWVILNRTGEDHETLVYKIEQNLQSFKKHIECLYSTGNGIIDF